MEESELEEGEACSYNTNDFGGTIDPDNDLSYIDEKLQNILGHFKKDFEGDFSAENLGAKFGGYGSFLPTYQRSPLWSYPKTPAKPQSSAGTRSPHILLGESQSGNAASSTVPKKAKPGFAASSRIPKKSMKSKKPNSSGRQESATKKHGVFSKQNSLKLRIKMGSKDNLSTDNNAAAIYSGLGLDLSPSLSSDNNSLSGSEGMNGEPQGLESPTSILNVMTSIPVDHCQLLSPLSDHLIRFIERENPQHGYKYTSPASAMAKDVGTQKAGEKQSVEKNRKMVERNTFSAETNVRSKKGVLDGIDATVKEPTEANTSYPENNGSVKREMVGDVDRIMWDLTRHKDPKTSSAGSVREDGKTNDDASGYSRKVGIYKGSNAPDLVKKETIKTKVKGVHKLEPDNSSRKQKSHHIEHKSSKVNRQADKKEVAALKPKSDGRKTEDTYKDFFGDMEDSDEEEEEEEEEQNCSPDVTEKGLPALEDMPEKSSFTREEMSKLGSDPKANPVIIQDNWVGCDKCGKWRLLPYGVLVEDLPKKWMCSMLNWLPDLNYCNVPEKETTKALYAMYQIPAPDTQAPIQSNPSGDDNTNKKKKGLRKIDNAMDKEVSRTAETNKKTILTSARNGLSDLDDEERHKHKHKQKVKGKAVDHRSDESRRLKVNNKRKADEESSMLAKKMKIESFLFPDESNGRPTSSSCVPAASAERNSKPRVTSKMPKEEGGGASDTGNSNSTVGSKKKKLKDKHGSRLYGEDENHERKKARVVTEEKESSFSHGNGKSEKKNRIHSKREYGHVAATSSSSKISDSHKPRNSSHEAKCSPVGSVSSSPMRIFNPEKSVPARKKKIDTNGEGEDDGESDRSQTRTKDKHGSYDSSMLDVWDNKGSLKPKERAEPSVHHRHSNDSLAKRSSGKGLSSRSKDKSIISSDSRDGLRQIDKKIYHASPDSRVDMVVRPNIPKPYDPERNNKADLASPSRPLSIVSARKKVDDTSADDDVTKVTTQIRRKKEPSPSPLLKEVTSAHNILKEAKDLKHTADRLKDSVSNLEFIEFYFQACLKFLLGAFVLEMSSNESTRQGDTMAQSVHIYSSTANLCGFCAQEYEKCKEMGAAALAYKCMEAAYMRVVNSSSMSANRYRNELQTSLQMVPPGESPSSSASDVDNVNHQAGADKVGNSRGISSPLVAGNHQVISAQNRFNILRLIQFAQNVNLGMDASRKSRVALAASLENLGEDQQQGEGILSIKSALDYNFQDLEGLLSLVKLAMKANNR